MLRRIVYGSCFYMLLSMPATAASPKVAVDIAPVHSLVASVMEGVGEPDLIVQSGASPHGYSLSPSEAKALQDADVVFWMGEEFTPWLASPLVNLAGSAGKVELLGIEGITVHEYREGATFEAHEHHDDEHEEGHEEGHGDEHDDGHDKGHDDKHEEGHHEEKAHHDEEHDKNHEDEHGEEEHHHGEHDPHAWLDPENAKVWLNTIAMELSKVDPANAEVYQSNASKAVADLDNVIATISEQTEKLSGIKFIVFHDAYQYFEQRFGVLTTRAISLGDASDPSPARVKEIRDTVAELGITCVFTEPQYNPELVRTVFENTSVTTIGVMDPLGADIKTGAGLYPKLLENLVSSLNQCQS